MAITCSFVIFVRAYHLLSLRCFRCVDQLWTRKAKAHNHLEPQSSPDSKASKASAWFMRWSLSCCGSLKSFFELSTFSLPAFMLASNDVTSSTIEQTFIVKLRVSLLLSPFCRKYSSLEWNEANRVRKPWQSSPARRVQLVRLKLFSSSNFFCCEWKTFFLMNLKLRNPAITSSVWVAHVTMEIA